MEDGVVRDISFQGSGCAISTASASLLTESVKGKSLEDAEALFESFHDLVTGLACRAEAADTGQAGGVFGRMRLPDAREMRHAGLASRCKPAIKRRRRKEAYPRNDYELLKDRVIAALQTGYDPEIPMNIYDLGLIYGLEIEAARARHA